VARLQEYGWVWGKIGWLVAFLYAVAAALRLARFNARISVADKCYFEGLPSPSAAGVVSGAVWLGTELELTGLPVLVLGFFVTAAAGTLMVSSFKYYSFKEWNLGGRVPFAYLLLVPLVFILIAANPPGVLFLMFATYAATGPALALLRLRRRARRQSEQSEQGEHTESGNGTGTNG
jgi:CDP-diacylglycerol---serine O-phosphatidyltransferase